jgi:protein ImuA
MQQLAIRPKLPQIVEDLRERIQQIERSPARLAEVNETSTGFTALNDLLVQVGLKRGRLIEWLGEGEGSGAASLALAVAAHMVRQEGILVVIDREDEFHPAAAAALGAPLERTVVIRPDTRMAALWAWEQSLRCPGVAVTLGWIEAIGDRLLRRLQLGVEAGGGLGFLLRPSAGRAAPSWASTRIGVKPLHSSGAEAAVRRVQAWLARGARETAIEVELQACCLLTENRS